MPWSLENQTRRGKQMWWRRPRPRLTFWRRGKLRSVASSRLSSRLAMASLGFWSWQWLNRCTRHSSPSQRRIAHCQDRIWLSVALTFWPHQKPNAQQRLCGYCAHYENRNGGICKYVPAGPQAIRRVDSWQPQGHPQRSTSTAAFRWIILTPHPDRQRSSSP